MKKFDKNNVKVKYKINTSKINTYAVIKANHFITFLKIVFRKTAFKKHK